MPTVFFKHYQRNLRCRLNITTLQSLRDFLYFFFPFLFPFLIVTILYTRLLDESHHPSNSGNLHQTAVTVTVSGLSALLLTGTYSRPSQNLPTDTPPSADGWHNSQCLYISIWTNNWKWIFGRLLPRTGLCGLSLGSLPP